MSKHRKHLGTSSIKRKAADQSANQALTLATICDMVLGEDAPKRDDETLIRGVRKLLNAELSDSRPL